MTDLNIVRAAYDSIAVEYAELLEKHLEESPFDRAMLAVFAELVRAGGNCTVADLGCGPGRLTNHLLSLGLDPVGVDLSPEMIRLARESHPGVQFVEGSMDELDVPDGAFGGVLAWYSTIHTPPQRLPGQCAEFARVLADDGQLLLAFQATDEPHAMQAYDHKVAPAYRRSPGLVTDLLQDADLDVTASLVRKAGAGERTPHAYLLATRRAR